MKQKKKQPLHKSFIERMRYLLNPSRQINPVIAKALFINQEGKIPAPGSLVDYVRRGYSQNATVYAIVRLIIATAQNLELKVYKANSQKTLHKTKSLLKKFDIPNKTNSYRKDQIIRENLKEVDPRDHLYNTLKNPNPQQTFDDFLSEYMGFGLLTGNRFIWGVSLDAVTPFNELYILPSQLVEITTGSEPNEPIKSYRINYINNTIELEPQDILHIKDFNPNFNSPTDYLYGLSPLQAGYNPLQINAESQQTSYNYIKNQMPRGAIVFNDLDGIDQSQMEAFRSQIQSKYQGTDKAGELITTNKNLSFVNFGLSVGDLALIEQYNLSIQELCRLYNVPPILLNTSDTSVYNNNMNEARRRLYYDCVLPLCFKLRDSLNSFVGVRYKEQYYIDFDFSKVPELNAIDERILNQLPNAWWITPNEKREFMGYDKIDTEEMDKIYRPAGIIDIEDKTTENMSESGTFNDLFEDL